MSEKNRKEINEHTRKARGGDERDSQGDGVADEAADKASRGRQNFAQPGTNREAVPSGIDGSIMEGEENDDASGSSGGKARDRAQGNERRVDDL